MRAEPCDDAARRRRCGAVDDGTGHTMHIVFAAGGTAGHIEPALNTADALIRADPAITVSVIGGRRGLESTLVPARGYDLIQTSALPLPRRPGVAALRFPAQTLRGVREASAHLRRVQANAVVGFGGYAAVPGYLAARRTRTPLLIHEANSTAGFANVLGARLTPHVATVHDGVLAGARHMALPIRRGIAELDRSAEREGARREWGLDPDAPVVLVFGGSQGARHLNEVVAGSLDVLLASGIGVVHALGARNELPPARPGYVPVHYVERMESAYAAADIVVCRAGAMTCAEVTAVGLPAIFVPLAVGNGEQSGNAAAIVSSGGGLQRADAQVTAEWLTDTIVDVVHDEQRLADMATAAAAHGDPDADDLMAKWIVRVAHG
jgi:UDP-N-acetylglucosamine--N-acetylmuramyl-(pentapeptide) pyrophosphoryl-undecaprenol N-acetylglucosamine transferase